MSLIIDASIALKWVLDEPDSERARPLLDIPGLAAPDLLWIECANVLWVKARRGQIAPESARLASAALATAPIRSLPTVPLVNLAMDIALDLGHSAYDCLYLAAALTEGLPLITADDAFLARVNDSTRYAHAVKRL